jgi:hypothetical protein
MFIQAILSAFAAVKPHFIVQCKLDIKWVLKPQGGFILEMPKDNPETRLLNSLNKIKQPFSALKIGNQMQNHIS